RRKKIGNKIGGRKESGGHGKEWAGSHAFTVQHEGVGRQPRGALRANVAEIPVQKFLDSGIARAEPVPELPVLLVVIAQQGSGEFEKVRAGGASADRLTHRG